MRYRKKPVVIEAVQYDGNFRCLDIFSINDVGKFIIGTDDAGNPCLKIPTLEGVMIASKGDYVIRGVKGEYYPCKPDIFEMTYEQDEPTIIQDPSKNYDAWDEVIDQLGETNKMIDHIGEVNEMVNHVADVGKMVNHKITLLEEDLWCVHKYLDDLQLARADKEGREYSIVGRIKQLEETLFTEEQVRELIKEANYDGQYLHAKSVTSQMMRDNAESYSDEIIQSLKQSK